MALMGSYDSYIEGFKQANDEELVNYIGKHLRNDKLDRTELYELLELMADRVEELNKTIDYLDELTT